jgi:hypothetical protein
VKKTDGEVSLSNNAAEKGLALQKTGRANPLSPRLAKSSNHYSTKGES